MSEPTVVSGQIDASGLRIGIVASRFNEVVVDRLVSGALDTLQRHGADPADVTVVWVPGAWELPVTLHKLAGGGSVDALIALGCVVRGATPHFDLVAGQAASGCAAVSHDHGLPVAFGVLTTDTWDQAVERAGGKLGNKRAEAAITAVEMARVLKQL